MIEQRLASVNGREAVRSQYFYMIRPKRLSLPQVGVGPFPACTQNPFKPGILIYGERFARVVSPVRGAQGKMVSLKEPAVHYGGSNIDIARTGRDGTAESTAAFLAGLLDKSCLLERK